MKKFKFVLMLLVTILITMGVSGCMANTINASKEIEAYLQNKYGCKFTVQKIAAVFDADNGEHIRAVCESEKEEGHFLVVCFADTAKDGDLVSVKGRSYVVCDKYPEVVFQNQLKKEVQSAVGEDAFVKCQVVFANDYLSAEEFADGMKACLDKPQLQSFCTVYVVTNQQEKLEQIQEQTESVCLQYNSYRNYMYFSTTVEADYTKMEEHFAEDPDSYDTHLDSCPLIQKAIFSMTERDSGITKQTMKKG